MEYHSGLEKDIQYWRSEASRLQNELEDFKLINKFKNLKITWRLEAHHENSNIIMIQYTGDESIYKANHMATVNKIRIHLFSQKSSC